MTNSTQDWADEIAIKLHGFAKQFDAEWPMEWLEVIKPTAAALRTARAEGEAAGELRGRAMGLREASNAMCNDDTSTQFDTAADKLSPLNPGGGEK